MDNDLISRNALKEKINNCYLFDCSFKSLTVAEFLTIIHDIIDNAPIVDTPYDVGYRQGVIDCFTEEWNGDVR